MKHIEVQELRVLTALAQKSGIEGAQVDWHLGSWQLWGWKKLSDKLGKRRALFMSSTDLAMFVDSLIEMAILEAEGK